MNRPYQHRVGSWILSCFNQDIAKNKQERVYRFLEEALELAQSLNCSKDDANKLVEYVFNRPIGNPKNEVGGTIVCIAALCNACGIDMEEAAEDELERVWDIKDKIRKKWEQKQIRIKTINDPLP